MEHHSSATITATNKAAPSQIVDCSTIPEATHSAHALYECSSVDEWSGDKEREPGGTPVVISPHEGRVGDNAYLAGLLLA